MATVILKVTEKCNAHCAYCDVVRKSDTGRSMSRETLELVFIRAGDYLRENPGEQVELLWHGGEPLLVGPEYFRFAAEAQKRHCGDAGSRVRHSIQTNLTTFSADFVEPFRTLGISAVGTSYDPEPNVRGIGKKLDSARYNRKFMESVRLLERYGIGWGMIYVVTKRSLARPLDVFHFLSNLVLRGGFNMNPVLVYGEEGRDLAVTPREYVEFLGRIFPEWWGKRHRYPDVEPFRSLVRSIVDGNVSLGCVDSGECGFHHINVAPDGSVSHCGRSADWGLLPYGSLADRSFGEILRDPQRSELARRSELLRATECADCRFWGLCHGGCPLDSWSLHKSFMHKTEWCEARRAFIEEYFEPVTGARFESLDGASKESSMPPKCAA